MYNINSKFVVGDNYVSPDNESLAGFATHIDKYGYGGLKTFSQSSMIYNSTLHYIGSGSATMSNNRSSVGQIVYLNSSKQYYTCYEDSNVPKFAILPGLTTGSPTFPGLTSSAGILITNGANISFSAGGNIATTGTASFSSVTASAGFNSSGTSQLGTLNLTTDLTVPNGGTGRGTFTQYGVLYGNADAGLLVTAQGAANSVLIANNGAPSFSTNLTLGGNIQTVGTASFGATTVSGLKSNGIISGSSTLNIVGNGSFGGLSVSGNTQLGNAATNTTSVFGTLSIVNNGSTSGSITSDASGNLILDGSGASSGVQITDGVLWLGASGSTGIQISSGSYGGPYYNGGMISSSMKIVALHGFANGTSDGDASFEVDINGNLQCASLKETSLRAYKHEIYYITESQLLNISKLKPVTFLYNQDVPQDVNDTRLRQAGFIAEQVQQIYPEVAWYKDGQLAGLQYQRLTAYLTRGIQELAEQNKLLKSRVQSLEQLVNGILQGTK